MSSFLIKVANQYFEAVFLGNEKQINGITHYEVKTPYGKTYANQNNIYLKVKELKHWNS